MSTRSIKYIITAITIFIFLLLSCERQNKITDSNPFLTWETIEGGGLRDVGNSIISTFNNGCIVVGTTRSFGAGGSDIYLIRLDSDGDTVWTKTYGADANDDGYSIAHTLDGGYIIAGDTPSYGARSFDMFLVKLDSKGDVLWFRTYGGSNHETACSIEPLPDGNSVIAGISDSFGRSYAVYLLKINQSGDTLWSKAFLEDANIYYRVAMSNTNSGFYIAGSYMREGDFSSHSDVFIIKTNSEGDSLFTRLIGGNGTEMGYAVVATPDGGCIAAGTTRSFGAGGDDVYLIRLNSDGDTVWTKAYGDQGRDVANSIISTLDGNFVIAGYTGSYMGADSDMLLMKIDIDGNLIWAKSIGSPNTFDWANSVVQAMDGGYLLTGYRSYKNAQYIYIVKTDPDGNL